LEGDHRASSARSSSVKAWRPRGHLPQSLSHLAILFGELEVPGRALQVFVGA
jgi:hypothetical protein